MKNQLPDWVPPATLEEAYERRLQLLEDIDKIQVQLGPSVDAFVDDEAPPEDPIGKRAWLAWRRKAKAALAIRVQHLRRTNLWIKLREAKPRMHDKETHHGGDTLQGL